MKLGYTILYVGDVAKALTHYQEAFGCPTLFLHESGLYGEAETGDTILSFAAFEMAGFNKIDMRPSDPADLVSPMNITFVTDDVAASYETAIAHGATSVMEPTEKPWGQVSAYLRDIDGHLVEIATPLHDRHR
ncbi:MAG: VOC family protein [Pseudomonadota bacterium]